MARFESTTEPGYEKVAVDDNNETWSPASSSDGTLHDGLEFPEIRKRRLDRVRQVAISAFAILPSPLLTLCGDKDWSAYSQKDFGSTTYLLGLRGMASFFVFVEHF